MAQQGAAPKELEMYRRAIGVMQTSLDANAVRVAAWLILTSEYATDGIREEARAALDAL